MAIPDPCCESMTGKEGSLVTNTERELATRSVFRRVTRDFFLLVDTELLEDLEPLTDLVDLADLERDLEDLAATTRAF